jgi:hypothetical protein
MDNEKQAIAKLRKQGKFIVVSEVTVCCPSTDAVIGRDIRIVGSFNTREEAAHSFIGSPECEDLYIVAPTKQQIARAAAEAEEESKRGFWTAARIFGILNDPAGTTVVETGNTVNNTFIIYRFIQKMFERQTTDEQASLSTNKRNNTGFTGADARLLSSMAEQSRKFCEEYLKKYGRPNVQGITPRMAKYAATRLKKYVKTQLVEIANTATSAPMPETVTQKTIEESLRRPEPQQLVMADAVESKVAELKRLNSAKYYDPFDEGERLTEESARQFWTKRFSSESK